MNENFKGRFLEELRVVKSLNLPQNQYLIWGSGPLAIRGIRESRDIDLLVSKRLWSLLAKTHSLSTEKMLRIGNIEIWNDCLNLNPKIDEMVLHPDMIQGFPFMNLADTIAWKRFMNRDKDLLDIALIEKYLKTNV